MMRDLYICVLVGAFGMQAFSCAFFDSDFTPLSLRHFGFLALLIIVVALRIELKGEVRR